MNSCNSNLHGDSKFVRITWVSDYRSLTFFGRILKKKVASVLDGILNSSATSLFNRPFSSSFKALYFTFKVTSQCFLLGAIVVVNCQDHNINTSTIVLKIIRLGETRSLINSDFRPSNWRKIPNFDLHDQNSITGPKNLFDLHDYSNYMSSNYRSSLIRVY